MPAAAKTKQEVVSEFRCHEILEAARKVFSRKGFEQTTVDDIAAAARVAKGTLYLYFPSKNAIYLEALKRDILTLHGETNQRVAAASRIEDKIRAFITTRVQFFEEHRDLFKIYYSEFSNFFVPLAPASKELRDLYLRQAKKLECVLQEAVERGVIRKICPKSTALLIYDMTLSLIAQRLLGWSKSPPEEDIQQLFDLLWRGIGTENVV